MPPRGEYEPSPSGRARDQVEEYESSGGTHASIAMEAFPGHAEHQTKTDREIPVFVLSAKN